MLVDWYYRIISVSEVVTEEKTVIDSLSALAIFCKQNEFKMKGKNELLYYLKTLSICIHSDQCEIYLAGRNVRNQHHIIMGNKVWMFIRQSFAWQKNIYNTSIGRDMAFSNGLSPHLKVRGKLPRKYKRGIIQSIQNSTYLIKNMCKYWGMYSAEYFVDSPKRILIEFSFAVF